MLPHVVLWQPAPRSILGGEGYTYLQCKIKVGEFDYKRKNDFAPVFWPYLPQLWSYFKNLISSLTLVKHISDSNPYSGVELRP